MIPQEGEVYGGLSDIAAILITFVWWIVIAPRLYKPIEHGLTSLMMLPAVARSAVSLLVGVGLYLVAPPFVVIFVLRALR